LSPGISDCQLFFEIFFKIIVAPTQRDFVNIRLNVRFLNFLHLLNLSQQTGTLYLPGIQPPLPAPSILFMDNDQLIQMIRQGGTPRERAGRYLQDKYFYLTRQIGVRKLRLSYDDANMAFSDALTELDWKIRQGETFDDLGKMIYTLTHRRGVDMIRKRATKTGTEPFGNPNNTTDLPDWFLDVLQNFDTDHILSRLLQHDDENERHQRQHRIIACVLKALDEMPKKRRALLVNKLDGYDYEELTQLHGFKTERVAHEMVSRGMESLRGALKDLCQQKEPVCRDLCAWLNRKS
jgi:DNA-directed RNA polymerase specialized sigma24 family protein